MRITHKATAVGLSLAMALSMAMPAMAGTASNPEPQGSIRREIKKGDVNNDGAVNAQDVLTALQSIAGIIKEQPAFIENADLNGDGNLTARDALRLLQNVAGLEDDGLGVENHLQDIAYVIPDGFEEAEEGIGFLGADGYGKYTTGGRGGRVIEVTNLNDSGEGSLRAAVEASGPRIVVFKVSGTIYLQNSLTIKNGDLTIAGQTAPGDGICLANYGLNFRGTQNVIVRYLRVRTGDQTGRDLDSVDIHASKDIIVDQCSVSWGGDETLSVSPDGNGPAYEYVSDRVSVQWNIISESMTSSQAIGKSRHGMGSLIRGAQGDKITYHHNYYLSHSSRVPMIGNYMDSENDNGNHSVEMINNLIYNWSGNAAGKSSDSDAEGKKYYLTTYNYINNALKAGPESTNNYMFSEASIHNHMYASGNMMNGVIPENQLSLIKFEDDVLATSANKYYVDHGEVLDQENYLLAERFADSKMTNIQSAADAEQDVLAYAGASLYKDSVDVAMENHYKNGTGTLINNITESDGWTGLIPTTFMGDAYTEAVQGQYPGLASYKPYNDTDKDGMSDEWEDAVGLDKNDSSDGAAAYKDTGFTNLDVFLQFLVENPEAAIGR